MVSVSDNGMHEGLREDRVRHAHMRAGLSVDAAAAW
jgi:hypothetical protein